MAKLPGASLRQQSGWSARKWTNPSVVHGLYLFDQPTIPSSLSGTHPIIKPQPPTVFLLLRYFTPLATPDSLHPILTHSPANSLQQDGDPPVSIMSILAGTCNDGFLESILIVRQCPLIALRAAWLLEQLACTELAYALRLRMIHLQASELLASEIVRLLGDQRTLLACVVVFPFATATSICRSKLTI